MFTDTFNLTEKASNPSSILGRYVIDDSWKAIETGSYNDGLLIICDDDKYGFHTLEEWSHLVGDEALPLAMNAWGEVFCISITKRCLLFLFPQENRTIELGQSITPYLDNLLVDAKLKNTLLDYERYLPVKNHLGPLPYGSCYILKPYQVLGGDESNPENYSIGDNQIYLSLVSQTHEQL